VLEDVNLRNVKQGKREAWDLLSDIIDIPAFPKTTCASIERLILLEHTTPYDNLEGGRWASGGGIPGGVDGLGGRFEMYPPAILLNPSASTYLNTTTIDYTRTESDNENCELSSQVRSIGLRDAQLSMNNGP
jgi:hypothetical protein